MMLPWRCCGRKKRSVLTMIQFGLRLHDAEKLPMEQLLPLIRQ